MIHNSSFVKHETKNFVLNFFNLDFEFLNFAFLAALREMKIVLMF